jgi:hypothetical protein
MSIIIVICFGCDEFDTSSILHSRGTFPCYFIGTLYECVSGCPAFLFWKIEEVEVVGGVKTAYTLKGRRAHMCNLPKPQSLD